MSDEDNEQLDWGDEPGGDQYLSTAAPVEHEGVDFSQHSDYDDREDVVSLGGEDDDMQDIFATPTQQPHSSSHPTRSSSNSASHNQSSRQKSPTGRGSGPTKSSSHSSTSVSKSQSPAKGLERTSSAASASGRKAQSSNNGTVPSLSIDLSLPPKPNAAVLAGALVRVHPSHPSLTEAARMVHHREQRRKTTDPEPHPGGSGGDEWEPRRSKKGDIYYYNVRTYECTWTTPSSLVTLTPGRNASPDGNGSSVRGRRRSISPRRRGQSTDRDRDTWISPDILESEPFISSSWRTQGHARSVSPERPERYNNAREDTMAPHPSRQLDRYVPSPSPPPPPNNKGKRGDRDNRGRVNRRRPEDDQAVSGVLARATSPPRSHVSVSGTERYQLGDDSPVRHSPSKDRGRDRAPMSVRTSSPRRKKGPPEPRDPRGDYYRPVYESDEASPMSHRSPSPSSHLQSHGRSEQSSITVSPRDTPRLLEPVQMQMRPPSRPSPSPQQHEVKHRWLEDDTTESDPKRRRIEPGLDAGPTQHATLSGRGDRAISPKHYITIEPSTSAALPPTDDGSQPSKRKRVPLPPQHQRFLMAKSTKAPAQPPPPVTRAQPPSAPQNDRDREREPAFPRTANQTMGGRAAPPVRDASHPDFANQTRLPPSGPSVATRQRPAPLHAGASAHSTMPTASADTNANTHTGVVNWGRDVDQDSRDHRESRDSKDGWENRDSRERDEKEREKKDLPTRPRAMATNTAPLLASVPPPAPALNHYRQRPIPPHLASGDNTGMRTGPRGGGGSGVKRSFADADGPEPMNVQPQPQRQQQLQPPAPTPASTAAAEAYARRSMEMDREGDKEREKERVEQRHSPEFSVQNRVADSKEPPVLRARNPPPRRGRGGGITGGPGASAPGAPASGPKIRVTGANDMPLTNRRPFGKAATPSASQQQEAFSAPPPEVTPRSMDVDIRESQRERTDRRDKERDRDRNSGAFEGHGVSRSPPEDFAMLIPNNHYLSRQHQAIPHEEPMLNRGVAGPSALQEAMPRSSRHPGPSAASVGYTPGYDDRRSLPERVNQSLHIQQDEPIANDYYERTRAATPPSPPARSHEPPSAPPIYPNRQPRRTQAELPSKPVLPLPVEYGGDRHHVEERPAKRERVQTRFSQPQSFPEDSMDMDVPQTLSERPVSPVVARPKPVNAHSSSQFQNRRVSANPQRSPNDDRRAPSADMRPPTHENWDTPGRDLARTPPPSHRQNRTPSPSRRKNRTPSPPRHQNRSASPPPRQENTRAFDHSRPPAITQSREPVEAAPRPRASRDTPPHPQGRGRGGREFGGNRRKSPSPQRRTIAEPMRGDSPPPVRFPETPAQPQQGRLRGESSSSQPDSLHHRLSAKPNDESGHGGTYDPPEHLSQQQSQRDTFQGRDQAPSMGRVNSSLLDRMSIPSASSQGQQPPGGYQNNRNRNQPGDRKSAPVSLRDRVQPAALHAGLPPNPNDTWNNVSGGGGGTGGGGGGDDTRRKPRNPRRNKRRGGE